MSPQEALSVIFNVTGQIQLNRADHQAVERALGVLQETVAANEANEDDKPSEK